MCVCVCVWPFDPALTSDTLPFLENAQNPCLGRTCAFPQVGQMNFSLTYDPALVCFQTAQILTFSERFELHRAQKVKNVKITCLVVKPATRMFSVNENCRVFNTVLFDRLR